MALGGPTEQEFLVDLLRLEPAGRPVRDERAAEIAAARAELREYFAGRRRHFSLRVDRRRLTAFQERVLACTADIPHGCVASYSAVAAAIARPGAARAVGGALGRNPVPIVIPCHRVIAADGSLGGFSVRGTRRSLGIKSRLLAIEQGRASGR